jgi:hypothetical protein
MVCNGCGGWVEPILDKTAQIVTCPMCGYSESERFLPLYIVTGSSGVGKTAVLPHLRRLLPDLDIFETDILWDSGGSWETVKCNWLRIAHSIAQSGRSSVLCGTIQPHEIEICDAYRKFSAIHWLALLCDEEELVRRLRARPAWRGCTESFIADSVASLNWFQDRSQSAFDPPLTVLDTTEASVSDTARRIAEWIGTR